MSTTTTAPDPFGFDRGRRTSTAQAQAGTPPDDLDPPFPWIVESFRPAFFGLDKLPDDEPDPVTF